MKKNIKNLIFFIFMVVAVDFIIQAEFDIYAAETSLPGFETTNVKIYGLEDWAKEYISIPAGYIQQYQIKVSNATNVSYRVISGDSVKVSSTGLITPKITTYYWKNMGGGYSTGTTYPDPDVVYDRITNEYEFGTSVIQINADGEIFKLTVEHLDYAILYADKVIDNYVSTAFNKSMSVEEVMNKICELPASYDYDASASGYVSMVVKGGGDCWASTDMILEVCDRLGYEAKSRNANQDPGAGSGHMNVLVTIGEGDYYELDAGYSGTAPRYYNVKHRTTLFSYYCSTEGATVYQYDGDIAEGAVFRVPDKIDSKTVIGVGEEFLAMNKNVSEIILPNTIKNIGKSAFNSCERLHTLNIPASVTEIGLFAFTNCNSLKNFTCSENNPNYKVINGVLYDKTGKNALFAPYCDNAKINEQTETIVDYAFYYNNNVKEITLSENVKFIGEGAFAACGNLSKVTIKNAKTFEDFVFADTAISDGVYFEGDAPVFSGYSFYRATTTVYYPESNSTWTEDMLKDYGGNITWKAYTPANELKGILKVNDLAISQTIIKGTRVTLTASGLGGSGVYTYKYAVYNEDNRKWSVLKDFSSATTLSYVMNYIGTKQFAVTVKDSKGKTVATNRVTVIVKNPEPLMGALNINGSTVTQTVVRGTKVNLSAVGFGGSGIYTYKYAVLNMDTGKWSVLKDFSSSSSFSYTMNYTGAKQFAVTIKDGNGKTVAANRVTVIVTEPITLKGILNVNNSTSTQTVTKGTKVNLSAVGLGGSGNYTYKFAVLNVDTGKWSVLKDFSTSSSFSYTMNYIGTKQFAVTVKDSMGKTVATNRVIVVVK